jgi:hypothetical protein
MHKYTVRENSSFYVEAGDTCSNLCVLTGLRNAEGGEREITFKICTFFPLALSDY